MCRKNQNLESFETGNVSIGQVHFQSFIEDSPTEYSLAKVLYGKMGMWGFRGKASFIIFSL